MPVGKQWYTITPGGMLARETFAAIERQYAGAGPESIHRLGKGNDITLLPNWIIHESRWNIRFYLADELLWAFRAMGGSWLCGEKLKGRGNWLCLHFSYCAVKCNGSMTGIDALLEKAMAAYPWMVAGYDRDTESDWNMAKQKIMDKAAYKKRKMGFVGFAP